MLCAALSLAIFIFRPPVRAPLWVDEMQSLESSLRDGADWACYTYATIAPGARTPATLNGETYWTCRRLCLECVHVVAVTVFGRNEQIVQRTYLMQHVRLGDLALLYEPPDAIRDGRRTGWAIWRARGLRVQLLDVENDVYVRRAQMLRFS